MHTLDAEFLYLEDARSPLHIAGISIFEGPPPSRAEVLQLYASKLADFPCYRQRARSLPLSLGRPVWVDDPHFDLSYHVRFTALPRPHDESALFDLVGRLMSQLLDRERPLWEAWVVEGLSGGRWALISKVHHALVDGISGVGLFAALLSPERDAPRAPEALPFRPEAAPTPLALVAAAFRALRSDAAKEGEKLISTVRDTRGRADTVRDLARGLRRLRAGLRAGTAVSLQGKVGPHRAFTAASVPFEDVQSIRKALGGTVNDVVLAILSGAYRALLLQRGDDVTRGPMRALVPISTRAAARHGTLDNHVAALFCDLPVHLAEPVARLRAVSEQMGQLKKSHVAEATAWLLDVGDLIPSVLLGSLTRAIALVMHRVPQRSFVTVATNVPGPPKTLYLLGRKMLTYYPYVPITQGARVGVAILSYDGQVAFGVTACRDSVPEIATFADALLRSTAELVEAAQRESASGTAHVRP
jgi:WS/DGAT/MGAT family acyltransferase